jgi:putative hydrolase of HD superfamily
MAAQVAFIMEIDKLKSVLRATWITDRSRHDNSAEHSWHLALMAMVLSEYAGTPVDLDRVLRLLLIHDIIEIDAGDVPAFGIVGHDTKEALERAAAERIFGLLPQEQCREMMALWEEFEAQETSEARFAVVIDRLNPLLQNAYTDGGTWVAYNVTRSQVAARMAPIRAYSQPLWEYVEAIIDQGVADGYIREESEEERVKSEENGGTA